MKHLRHVISSLVVLSIINQALFSGSAYGATTETWYPFALADTLDVNSPANVGKLVLDAPAGKHGYLKVTNGNFVFEDGTPIQFWGTNIASSACFPTKAQADLLAERLSFLGFNAVRLMHMENYFDPYGIFQDMYPTSTNPQSKITGMLSSTQLDKLDYLISALKKKGIYIVINLMSGRNFTTLDGMADADKFEPGARPVSMFDPVLIELQKQYAKDLLNHYNSYTMLPYRNDPAIAIVEMTNENSIIEFWELNALNGLQPGQTVSLPPYYIQELDQQWNTWLKTKYSTVAAVKSAWVPPNTSSSTIISPASDISSWQLAFGGVTSATKTINGTTATVNVNSVSSDDWGVQFSRGSLNFKAANRYRITFTAKAATPTPLRISMKQLSPLLNLTSSQTTSLTTTLATISLDFTPNADTTTGSFSFNIGKSVNTLTFQDLIITEYPPVSTNTNTTISASSDISSWQLAFGGVTSATKTISGTTATVNVKSVSSDDWGVQFSRGALAVKATSSYRVTFTAKATTPTSIRMAVKQVSPSLYLAPTPTISLTTTPTAITLDFTPSTSTSNASFILNIGRSVNTLTFQDLVITEYPAGALAPVDTNTTFDFARPLYNAISNLTAQKRDDILKFYNDLNANYFAALSKIIKTDLGSKVLLTGISGNINLDDVPTQAAMNVIDFHAYWDHPRFPGTPWDLNNFTIKNTSMLTDPNLGIIGSLKTKAQSAPSSQAFTVMEWNSPSPNIYAFETPILMATTASLSSWDGIFHCTFSQDTRPPDGFKSFTTFFDDLGNTQKLILNAVGAFLIKKVPKTSLQQQISNGIFTVSSPLLQGTAGAIQNQQITLPALTITSTNNAAIFIYSLDGQPINTSQKLLLTVAGQIKNTNGGWISGKYEWGTAPVLLQSIAANIKLLNSNKLKAFPLNTAGQRMLSPTIATTYTTGAVSFSTSSIASPWIELNVQ